MRGSDILGRASNDRFWPQKLVVSLRSWLTLNWNCSLKENYVDILYCVVISSWNSIEFDFGSYPAPNKLRNMRKANVFRKKNNNRHHLLVELRLKFRVFGHRFFDVLYWKSIKTSDWICHCRVFYIFTVGNT